MSHHDDKKSRKKEQLKKNRKQQEIFNAFRIMRAEGERVQEEGAQRAEAKASPESSGEERVWSEKVNTIRNKLTGKSHSSKERWNRFAGTSGGGGRGL